jgi:hypothetical protein
VHLIIFKLCIWVGNYSHLEGASPYIYIYIYMDFNTCEGIVVTFQSLGKDIIYMSIVCLYKTEVEV